jgi:hypothetical protein
MGRRIASQSKQTVRGGPKPAKVGLHRRLVCGGLKGRVKQAEAWIRSMFGKIVDDAQLR